MSKLSICQAIYIYLLCSHWYTIYSIENIVAFVWHIVYNIKLRRKVSCMNFELLRKSIFDINELHKTISEDHFSNTSYNLRNMSVKDVVISNKVSSEFLEYIDEYYEKLNLVIAYSDFDVDYKDWDGRIRLKQKESIQNKLLYYYSNHEDGRIAIQKCLNDLLGFRLILDEFHSTSEEFKMFMEEVKTNIQLMRWYNRDRDGYIATHIYFKNMNNKYFPWELQLWNTENAISNEISHAEHKAKREYIIWPKKYKEGTLSRKDDE